LEGRHIFEWFVENYWNANEISSSMSLCACKNIYINIQPKEMNGNHILCHSSAWCDTSFFKAFIYLFWSPICFLLHIYWDFWDNIIVTSISMSLFKHHLFLIETQWILVLKTTVQFHIEIHWLVFGFKWLESYWYIPMHCHCNLISIYYYFSDLILFILYEFCARQIHYKLKIFHIAMQIGIIQWLSW